MTLSQPNSGREWPKHSSRRRRSEPCWDWRRSFHSNLRRFCWRVGRPRRKRLQFAYDAGGRRASKTVSSWNGSSFANPSTVRFVYDGWNVLAILDPNSAVTKSFVWGQDVSGTIDQASGIGGLLMVEEHGTSATNHFITYDGNGNVT